MASRPRAPASASQSGNPKGRPVGAFKRQFSSNVESLFDAVRRETARPITVREGAEEVEMPMIQAAFRTWMVKAVQGSARHGELVAKFAAMTENQDRRQHEQLTEQAIEYKVYWEEELERRRRRGIFNLPNPFPHPNQILIDSCTGDVSFVGPMSRQEKAEWEAGVAEQRRLVDDLEAEKAAWLADVEATYGDDPRIMSMLEPARQNIAKQLAEFRAIIADFEATYYLGRS